MKTSDVVFPAGRAKKKAKSRRRGSRQRVTKVTISEPEPGLSEEPVDTSLDREETRKRRFGRCPFIENLKEIIQSKTMIQKSMISSKYI